MIQKKILLVMFLVFFSFALVSADVGIGISPSKMREQVTAGETYTYDFLVFNTGSQDIDLTLSATGEIAEFVTITEPSRTITPEPLPHEFPIKNGKTFTVTIDIPKSSKQKTYTGAFAAVGGGSSESRFGGSVGVSSQVEFISVPPKSFFAKLTNTHYIILGSILGLLLLIFIFKKLGIRIQVGKK